MRSAALLPLLLLAACCCSSNQDPFDEEGRELPWARHGTDEQFAFTRCTVHQVPVPDGLATMGHGGPPAAFQRDPDPAPATPPPGLTLDQLARWAAPTTLDHIAALQDGAAGRDDGTAAVVAALGACVEDGPGDTSDDPTGRCLRALALLDRPAAVEAAVAHREALRDPDARALAATLELYPDHADFLAYLPLRGPLSEVDRDALADPALLTVEDVLRDRERLVAVDPALDGTAEGRIELLATLAHLVRPQLDDALFDADGDVPRLYLYKSRYTPILEDNEQADLDTCVGLINTVLLDQGSLQRVIRVPSPEPAVVVVGGRGEGLVFAHDDELIGLEPLSRFPGSASSE